MSLTFIWLKTDPAENFCAWTQSVVPLASARGEVKSKGSIQPCDKIRTPHVSLFVFVGFLGGNANG